MWSPNKVPHGLKQSMAQAFGVPREKIRVNPVSIGGDFGGKGAPIDEPICYLLALRCRRPVKMVMEYREEFFAGAPRHAAILKLRTGVKRDGTIIARKVEGFYDTGAYALTGPSTTKNGGEVGGGPYRIAHQDLTTYCVYTNTPPTGPYRGFGVPQVCWAYESQMDDIARRLGIDPLELRLKNLVQEGDRFVTGDTLVSVGISDCLKRAAQAVGWRSTPALS